MEISRLFGLVLAASALLISVGAAEALDFALTPAQNHFTSVIRALPGIVHTEWKSPVSLYLRANSKAVGSPPSPRKAQKIADTLVERGRSAMRQPFCIHIIYGKNKPLARSCAYE